MNRKIKLMSSTLIAASIMACGAALLPTEVSYLGETEVPRPLDVAVSNNTAYVSSNTNGFLIVDVSNPESPVQLSHITKAENPNLHGASEVEVRDGLAYVAGVGGLVVLDVSNPLAPNEVSFTPITGTRGIEVVGDLAFVLSLSDGLYVFNIANPASPMLISLTPYSSLNFVTAANGLAVEGDYAFLRSHKFDSSKQGVELIDISNPATPVVVGGIETTDVPGIGGVDTTYAPGILVKGNTVFLTNKEQGYMQSYDITDAAAPALLGTFVDSAGVAFDKPSPMTTVGNLMYVWSKATADDADPAGISVLDISNPSSIIHKVSLFDDASMRLESARYVNKIGDKLYLPVYVDQSLEILSIK